MKQSINNHRLLNYHRTPKAINSTADLPSTARRRQRGRTPHQAKNKLLLFFTTTNQSIVQIMKPRLLSMSEINFNWFLWRSEEKVVVQRSPAKIDVHKFWGAVKKQLISKQNYTIQRQKWMLKDSYANEGDVSKRSWISGGWIRSWHCWKSWAQICKWMQVNKLI